MLLVGFSSTCDPCLHRTLGFCASARPETVQAPTPSSSCPRCRWFGAQVSWPPTSLPGSFFSLPSAGAQPPLRRSKRAPQPPPVGCTECKPSSRSGRLSTLRLHSGRTCTPLLEAPCFSSLVPPSRNGGSRGWLLCQAWLLRPGHCQPVDFTAGGPAVPRGLWGCPALAPHGCCRLLSSRPDRSAAPLPV